MYSTWCIWICGALPARVVLKGDLYDFASECLVGFLGCDFWVD